jgi:hypothetical protein
MIGSFSGATSDAGPSTIVLVCIVSSVCRAVVENVITAADGAAAADLQAARLDGVWMPPSAPGGPGQDQSAAIPKVSAQVIQMLPRRRPSSARCSWNAPRGNAVLDAHHPQCVEFLTPGVTV